LVMMFLLTNLLWHLSTEDGEVCGRKVNRTEFVAPRNVATIVMSFVGDANVLCDWWFYSGIKDEDNQAARDAVLLFAIVGTVTWLNHAVLHGSPTSLLCLNLYGTGDDSRDVGQTANPCVQVCCMGMWSALLWEVILNDIAMLVLTIVIESVKAGELTESGEFGPAAVMNIVTACGDILAKIYEAYSFMKREAKKAGPDATIGSTVKQVISV